MEEESTGASVELPGFRFHPTEEELVSFYLKNMIVGQKLHFDIIGCLNIYHHDPWELPGLAKIGEREWYFFVPRDVRKQGNGGRPNRITETGFWKATGSDRKILSSSDPKKIIGLKKTLVFYKGRAPRPSKTDWVMNEYRLPDTFPSSKDIVLCKIYRKATSLKVLEQRAAMEEQVKIVNGFIISPPADPMEIISFCSSKQHEDMVAPMAMGSTAQAQQMAFKKEEEEEEEDLSLLVDDKKCELEAHKLPELQVPKLSVEWTQDPFWTQLRSPWLDNLTTPPHNYTNLLNF